jgi:hypothetical protein
LRVWVIAEAKALREMPREVVRAFNEMARAWWLPALPAEQVGGWRLQWCSVSVTVLQIPADPLQCRGRPCSFHGFLSVTGRNIQNEI